MFALDNVKILIDSDKFPNILIHSWLLHLTIRSLTLEKLQASPPFFSPLLHIRLMVGVYYSISQESEGA